MFSGAVRDGDGDCQISDDEINEVMILADTSGDGLIVHEGFCSGPVGQQTFRCLE